jgi:hypothetical protein
VLRYAFFDDFKGGPKMLFWGQAAGMPVLAPVLRRASGRPGTFPIMNDAGFHSVDGSRVTIVSGRDESGLRRRSGTAFDWRMTSETAHDFAELVDGLAGADHGHRYLEHHRNPAGANNRHGLSG